MDRSIEENVIQEIGLLVTKDEDGVIHELYPVTTINSVEGLNDNLSTKINTSDVVDNLESTSTVLPLSANQGNALNANLSDKISFDTYELLWSNPTETDKTETVSVDLSKYKAILLMETKNTTVVYGHALIPINIFKLGLDHEASHYFEGERVCLYAKYNSDTSIYCRGYGYVYGIN